MDLDDFRVILSRAKADVWAVLEAAIAVAAKDHGEELKHRRDKIVEMLYTGNGQLCGNCGRNDVVIAGGAVPSNNVNNKSPLTPESDHRNGENEIEDHNKDIKSNKNDDVDEDGEDVDPYGGLFDDEQTEILRIKERLEDPDQDEESVVELLQSLADMDITFQALKETDIGRHVNKFRKHPSNEVRKLVKQLVRKWKETVDEWVRLNEPEKASSNLIADGDSPQQQQQNITKSQQNGNHHQVPDFAYSPNPQNGGSSSDRTHSTPEHKAKAVPPQREAPSRPLQSAPKPTSAPPPTRPPKETSFDMEKLNSARRRLHENYQEAQNAKKQRTIQVMDIHEIPKPKNAFISKNKGGFQGRHHR